MDATAQPHLFEPDREVPDSELEALWEAQRREGRIVNGATDSDLHARYGERVYHSPGVGWFVRPESSLPLYA